VFTENIIYKRIIFRQVSIFLNVSSIHFLSIVPRNEPGLAPIKVSKQKGIKATLYLLSAPKLERIMQQRRKSKTYNRADIISKQKMAAAE
jgi:hypothetical protein